MDVLREWRRRLVGGTVIAVLAPGAIVAAGLAVGIFGGGIQGLGRLGQTLTGPALPTVEPAPSASDGSGDAGDLLDRATRGDDRARAPRDGARRPARSAPRRGGGRRTGDRREPRPPGEGPPSSRPPAPNPSPQPTPTPTPPSTIRQVGEQVKQVTNDVPVAGEPTGQVIDLVVETAESLPIPPNLLP